MSDWIEPEWPAPPHVRALTTTRTGGFSRGPYASLNLGDHVGDDPDAVARNRALLSRELGLKESPLWLSQVHGCTVALAGRDAVACEADATVARGPGQVCAVLTADCLPLLLCDRAGTRVAAVHAGWRGLAGGVIESAVADLGLPGADLLCWLGPAIGPEAFEVGDEVRRAFLSRDSRAEEAFRAAPGGRWLADIYCLARQRLAACGVGFVAGGGYCTVNDAERFFSYRRDRITGRMASLIWMDGTDKNNLP